MDEGTLTKAGVLIGLAGIGASVSGWVRPVVGQALVAFSLSSLVLLFLWHFRSRIIRAWPRVAWQRLRLWAVSKHLRSPVLFRRPWPKKPRIVPQADSEHLRIAAAKLALWFDDLALVFSRSCSALRDGTVSQALLGNLLLEWVGDDFNRKREALKRQLQEPPGGMTEGCFEEIKAQVLQTFAKGQQVLHLLQKEGAQIDMDAFIAGQDYRHVYEGHKRCLGVLWELKHRTAFQGIMATDCWIRPPADPTSSKA